jgi:hypothetical protein
VTYAQTDVKKLPNELRDMANMILNQMYVSDSEEMKKIALQNAESALKTHQKNVNILNILLLFLIKFFITGRGRTISTICCAYSLFFL